MLKNRQVGILFAKMIYFLCVSIINTADRICDAVGVASCWIHRAKEEFETEWGKELLKSLGIEGEYEGIGHCALGYIEGEYPAEPARKENRVYYVK